MTPLGPKQYIPGIAPEGYNIVAGSAAITLATLSLSPRWALLPLALTAGSALFFRDPVRPQPNDARGIFAAADGLITRVDTVDELRYIEGPALRIVTFLSLFDVHINRAPTGGTVEYLDYKHGEFRAAWDAEADEVNERNYIGMATSHGPVLMVQIAGLVARRIVCHLENETTVGAGERIGMIKFGSRTDVLVPHAAARAL